MRLISAAVATVVIWALTAAAAASGGTALNAHAKAGVASSRYLATAPGKLSALGASWSYDWSATPPPADAGLQWVPMIWGSGSITPTVLSSLRHQRAIGRARYLLGFNEPDNGGQSNMTPSQAAALWPKLQSTGLILGSPAVATPSDGWLAAFMKLAAERHLRVDFIALHYYQDFTNPDAVAQLKSQLTAIHRQYHRPIWITEIGSLNIASWNEPMAHPASEALAVGYMRRLFSMLDGLSFVQRYAWFTDQCWNDVNCHTASLFGAGGQPTALGRAFRTSAASAAAAAVGRRSAG